MIAPKGIAVALRVIARLICSAYVALIALFLATLVGLYFVRPITATWDIGVRVTFYTAVGLVVMAPFVYLSAKYLERHG
jgi:hypothetical protein